MQVLDYIIISNPVNPLCVCMGNLLTSQDAHESITSVSEITTFIQITYTRKIVWRIRKAGPFIWSYSCRFSNHVTPNIEYQAPILVSIKVSSYVVLNLHNFWIIYLDMLISIRIHPLSFLEKKSLNSNMITFTTSSCDISNISRLKHYIWRVIACPCLCNNRVFTWSISSNNSISILENQNATLNNWDCFPPLISSLYILCWVAFN